MEPSNSGGVTGVRERLGDLVLAPDFDSTVLAGAVSRFDANLSAIRTLKKASAYRRAGHAGQPMQRHDLYVWTVGYRGSGDPMISGPFISEDDAADGTSHLSNVRFIRLATRNRAVALPQIREQLKHGHPKPHADAHMDLATKRSIMDKILHRNKPEDELA